MKPNTSLVIDVWEGNMNIDEAALKAAGVAGIGIRLNDMNGGHHMDTEFLQTWAGAVNFVRFPYFVYNPWVDAAANFAWLIQHIPAEAKSVAVDIEVAMAGYSPANYAGEIAKFIQACQGHWRTIIYTAQWFLPNLTKWPSVDYWWAAYPDPKTYTTGSNQTTWDAVKSAMDKLDKPGNAGAIPGALKMWQFSGDYFLLPGMTGKVDLNVFYGTEADLAEYFSTTSPIPLPMPAPVPGVNFPRIMRIKDDLEAGYASRPFIRNGLPSTVRLLRGKGAVTLSEAWMNYVARINTASAYNYLFKDASGWHNQGADNNVQELTFSGNRVKVLEITNGYARIETLHLNDPIPEAIFPNILNMSTIVHYFTAQYTTHLDMSTSGRWPKMLLMANPGETLWMNMNDLAPLDVKEQVVTVARPIVNLRANPMASSSAVGARIFGQRVPIHASTRVGYDFWGQVDLNVWMALKYQGNYFTDWRES